MTLNPLADRLNLGTLQSEVARLLDRLWHYGVSTGPLDGLDYAPPVDVQEEPDRFLVTAELPGVDLSALDVSIAGTTLTIQGEKPPAPGSAAGSEPGYTQAVLLESGRRYGRFRRTIRLPAAVRHEEVSARMVRGVLEVSIPKAVGGEARSVRVTVRDEDHPAEADTRDQASG